MVSGNRPRTRALIAAPAQRRGQCLRSAALFWYRTAPWNAI